ncbi:hypothetical protein [Streptomyces geranii]|uniref:hypothetical protein n=1 Tax=Streptomyces geranii TaxID=2058923 RepID=UPI0013003EFB|nr:hypothetical protein [Streptomyces geranii]
MEPGELSEEARVEMRRALVDKAYRAARHQYVSTTLAAMVNIESWLAVDSWLGAGKLADTKLRPTPDEVSYSAFRAVSTVVCMSTELADAAVAMAEKERYYAVGAVIRQLIECEYLLALFSEDLDHARGWFESTPEQVRSMFAPTRMRKLTGKFSNEEYWNHCSTGGHPAPKGIGLLQMMDPPRKQWPYASAELLIDLGLHLHRIWKAMDQLLMNHHARYEAVRADQRDQAERAWVTWQEADPVVAVLIEAWRIG